MNDREPEQQMRYESSKIISPTKSPTGVIPPTKSISPTKSIPPTKSISPTSIVPATNIIPHVIEHTARGERSADIWSRLLADRIVFLAGEVDDFTANSIVAQMLFLEKADPDSEILLYINSPGGSVTAGLSIYSTIQTISCDVQTCCFGIAMSMGALLLAAGTHGHRFALPYTRILIHQVGVQRGPGGTATDIDIWAREMLRTKAEMNEIMARHTGQSVDRIAKDTDRDFYMSPQEAKEYGIIDDIIETKKKPIGEK
ncbi:MAG TPA: ATP-dependent Clp protease proteolytic subunit [Armatimonadota bacterium]|nr:ATP-dependent Clp protease proteolytic subunit [Armatimonadota bacterium]